MSGNWIDRLERRFGEWCIPQLAFFIVVMNAVVYLLSLQKIAFPLLLSLEPHLVFQGQAWRVFTFLLIPPLGLSILWMFFWLYLLYVYAVALEQEWGDFRFNLFYFLGAAATVATSLAAGVPLSNTTLHTTIFLAFAALFPDFEVLLFFVLPVKVKWLAWLAWAGMALGFVQGGPTTRLGLAAGLVNYAAFFGPRHWQEFEQWRRRRKL
ncbi:MAG: hypothetical protein HY078_01040 [Elusimicrobia bacterium]|nr:hypothetical protein [Elusimicrobiota bacterium]